MSKSAQEIVERALEEIGKTKASIESLNAFANSLLSTITMGVDLASGPDMTTIAIIASGGYTVEDTATPVLSPRVFGAGASPSTAAPAPVKPSWKPYALPVGPQPLPGWLRDLHIDWRDKFENRPSITLKTNCDAREWERKEFVVEDKSFYRAYHEDGRLEQYAYAPLLRFDANLDAWTGTQLEGFGGGHYRLQMKGPRGERSFLGGAVRLAGDEWVTSDLPDGQRFAGNYYGKDVVLRGPWSTRGPLGYEDVAYVDVDAAWRVTSRLPKRPWYGITAMGGLFISHDLLARALARFQPHLRAAIVTDQYGAHLEPIASHWNSPKNMTLAQLDDPYVVLP